MSNCDFVTGRSLIDLAASRLALRAPALRAATSLTRPNRSAQRLACDRHSVRLANAGGPNDVVANHSVEHRDHLSHHRDGDDFREFAGRGQTTMEGLQYWVPIAGAQGGHVQHMANGCASTPNTTLSFELAAVEVIGSDADKSCDLFSAQLAELRQQRNQRAGQNRSNARHRGEQPVSAGQASIRCDDPDQVLVEHFDIGGKSSDAIARKSLQHRVFQQPRSILYSDFLLSELATNSNYFAKSFGRRRRALCQSRRHDSNKRCDQTRIQPIVLSQNSARLGELPELERIDLTGGGAFFR